MISPSRRRCRHCRERFIPDYRNAYHQRFCSSAVCQHASKRASQRRWLCKPQNRNYFREPDNSERVRQWRQLHPGYWRTDKHSPTTTGPGKISAEARTLQEFCRSKAAVLTELVSSLGGYALQEDIGRWASEVVTEAQCILEWRQLRVISQGQLELPISYHETG
jgi:hypothetical protein